MLLIHQTWRPPKASASRPSWRYPQFRDPEKGTSQFTDPSFGTPSKVSIYQCFRPYFYTPRDALSTVEGMPLTLRDLVGVVVVVLAGMGVLMGGLKRT